MDFIGNSSNLRGGLWNLPFYINPTKINLNMIILMLLSQYFHNKCYMASCNWFLFGPIINIIFYLPLTTCHLDFVIIFLWKYCVLNIIKKKSFIFAPLLKIYVYILCKTLVYFTFDNKMKLFFHALFFSIRKKLHYYYNEYISIYICDSFSLSLWGHGPKLYNWVLGLGREHE